MLCSVSILISTTSILGKNEMEKITIALLVLLLLHATAMDQGILLRTLRSKNMLPKHSGVYYFTNVQTRENEEPPSSGLHYGSMNNDAIFGGLPGQPSDVKYKQYSGYISIDELHGKALFYYFVEATGHSPTAKPLVLWLNGGPGCSSVGIGAFEENGPFGVQQDGKTLYSRRHSWNKVANMLYLESPIGVGFSYTNNSSDYYAIGDSRTAQDSYTFLLNWFKRFPHYKMSDFFIAGESYAGYYIPELAEKILENMYSHQNVKLKGIMIGNGLMNMETDMRGMFDYLWSHALISSQTHQGILQNCFENGPTTMACTQYQQKLGKEMGDIDVSSITSDPCSTLGPTRKLRLQGNLDPCEQKYINSYLNLPEVQYALHASNTKLPHHWAVCSYMVNSNWSDSPSTMFPLYRKLMAFGIRILLYSGDMDGVIPVTSTQYSIDAMNLTVKNPWRPWLDDVGRVGGYRVDYNGLIFATVRGAGHEVPKFQPLRALSLLRWFLRGT